MKTAEEILEMHFGSDFHEINKPCYLDHILAAMKEYASEVAKEVLKRAADNAMLEPDGMMLQVDKDSILNTEYQDLLK